MENYMSETLPSVWLGDFHSKSEFDSKFSNEKNTFEIFDWIDNRMLQSRHPFTYPAYCVVCEKTTKMRISWMYGGWSNMTESIHPAWTETGVCESCGLNSRMRALYDFLKNRIHIETDMRAYIAEEVTPFFRKLKSVLPKLMGSEFIGPNIQSGKKVPSGKFLKRIRHEDLTNLSFENNSFDLMITLDVFEHIPNFQSAFQESYRILDSNGLLVFTIPFFFDRENTTIRATIDHKGEINHILPPEIHGNPVSKEGSLCFQNFGWDILDSLRQAGFKEAKASLYWAPWQGHLGYPFFVFSALK